MSKGTGSNTSGTRKPQTKNNSNRRINKEEALQRQLEAQEHRELMTELLIWIVLIVSIILLLCVFNLCGPLSNVFGALLFGLFGFPAYIFPILLFFSICFYRMNSNNKRVVRRVICSWVLYINIAAIIQLFTADQPDNLFSCYTYGYTHHAGGGFLGACVSKGLTAVIGSLATGILLFITATMLVVFITGKMLASFIVAKSTSKYNDYIAEVREQRRIRREEQDDIIDYDQYISDNDSDDIESAETSGKPKKRFSYKFPDSKQSKKTNINEVEEKNDAPVVSNQDDNSEDVRVSTADDSTTDPDNMSEDIPVYEREIKEKFGSDHSANDNSLELLVARALENDRVQYTEFDPYVEDYSIEEQTVEDTDNISITNNAEQIYVDDTDYSKSPSYEDSYDSDESEKTQESFVYEDDNHHDSYTYEEGNHQDSYTYEEGNHQDSYTYEEDNHQDSYVFDENKYNDSYDFEEADNCADSENNNMVHKANVTTKESTTKESTTKESTTKVSITKESITEEPVNIEMPPQPIPYIFPPLDLLEKPSGAGRGMSEIELKETARKLQDCLKSFKVEVKMTDIICGPTVTRYELQPSLGTRVKKITELENDIKLNLAASDIRIEAPIPGKSAVGIEVPNPDTVTISLREMLETKEFRTHKSNVAFGVGKDIGGHNIVADIAKMPHMLIAGSTGSGKSVCINTIVMSLLYKADPNDVKLIMVDPKVVELSIYNGIPHLCIPVVTDPKKAAAALNWAVAEMEERYNKFAKLGARNIKGYNDIIDSLRENPDMYVKMPHIIIIVDELADLMMVASHDVETAICRLAQKARAAGLHLILATQRPSVDVITGLIKNNVPSRIAFAVSSAIDSRTILDGAGAEKLLGKGDMLFYPQGLPKPIRVQGAFVSDAEVARVTEFVKNQYDSPVYDKSINEKITNTEMSGNTAQADSDSSDSNPNGWDEKFEEAGRFIIEKQKASIGTLQRVFKIGFNRGARIMDQLCEAGVVGEEDGKKPRNILMTMEEFERLLQEGH